MAQAAAKPRVANRRSVTMKKRGAPGSRRLRPGAEWTAFRPAGPENGARSRRALDAVAEGAQRDNT